MFYEIRDELRETDISQINKKYLTVGFVNSDELAETGKKLGFDDDTIEASRKANPLFRTGVDVRETYTFAELKIQIKRNLYEKNCTFICGSRPRKTA